MLFTKLKLNYFGRFINREIELKPGINLICGDNEAGKSTIHTFMKGMLFGIERLRGRGSASKEDIYTKYLPWDYPGAYSGSMDILVGDKEYRLQRSFHANDKSFTILELSTGREMKLKEELISELIPGLTESAFRNTISIEQLKAQTDAELAAQVHNYITNLSIARSKEVNVAEAVSSLTEKRKQLETSINSSALNILQAGIDEGLFNEERIERLTLQLRELQKEEQNLLKLKSAAEMDRENDLTKRMEQLPAILEKYHTYEELNKQEESLISQLEELKSGIELWMEEQKALAFLNEDISFVNKAQKEISEQEISGMELQKQKESLMKEEKRNLLVSLLPTLILTILSIFLTSISPVFMAAAAAFIIAGVATYLILKKKLKGKQKALDKKQTEHKQRTDAAKSRIEDILSKYKLSRVEELQGKKEEVLLISYELEHAKEQMEDLNNRKLKLEDSKDIIYEVIMKYLQYFIPEEELTYYAMKKLQDEIAKRKQDSYGRLSEINLQLEHCKIDIEKLKWEITALEGNEEELLKNKERYEELLHKREEDTKELEAVKLALSTIQELSSNIHDSFGQQLNQSVSEVISEVTGRKYTDLKIDEKLEVKVGLNGSYVLLNRLSAGTIDQVYFALRMAVADLLLGKEIPLLLDDSFALYDDTRVRAVLTTLAMRRQVILFTCHKREQQLLDKLKLPYHLVELSCS